MSTFQKGIAYWTQATGATEVHGDIKAKWDALGGFEWGAPATSVQTIGSGQWVSFGFDRGIYQSAATGVHSVNGQIFHLWNASGGAAGPYGFPTSDESGASGGVRLSTFQNAAIYWTATGGTHAVFGAIFAKWMVLGALSSGFGVPVTNELATPDRVGRYNHFANDTSMYWSPATGAQAVRGQIRNLWSSLGWEKSLLGYPTSDELPTADGRGRYNAFQTGAVIWTAALGPHAVYGSIYQRWVSLGGVTSSLGYPTSDEYSVPGGRASDFERGRITWSAATGAVTVTSR
jgi:uncharacterized protein with LGFP repeats